MDLFGTFQLVLDAGLVVSASAAVKAQNPGHLRDCVIYHKPISELGGRKEGEGCLWLCPPQLSIRGASGGCLNQGCSTLAKSVPVKPRSLQILSIISKIISAGFPLVSHNCRQDTRNRNLTSSTTSSCRDNFFLWIFSFKKNKLLLPNMSLRCGGWEDKSYVCMWLLLHTRVIPLSKLFLFKAHSLTFHNASQKEQEILYLVHLPFLSQQH